MSRRLIVLATVVLLALGVAVAVLAARPDSAREPTACTRSTFFVEDPTGPKVMTYHGDVCAEDGGPAEAPEP